MFHELSVDVEKFRNLIDTIGENRNEIKLTFGPDGITANVIDEDRLCLFQLNLTKEEFLEYKCYNTEEIGFDMAALFKILSRFERGSVTILQDKGIWIKQQDQFGTRKFKLPRVDVGDQGIKPEALEKLEYPKLVKMHLSTFKQTLEDASSISEVLGILMTESALIFTANHDLGQQYSNEIAKDSKHIEKFCYTPETNEETVDLAISHLKKMVKIQPKTDSVELSFLNGSSCPVKIHLDIFEHSTIRFFQAPRVYDEKDIRDFPKAELSGDKYECGCSTYGCSHYSGGKCRLTKMKEDCVFGERYHWRCCPRRKDMLDRRETVEFNGTTYLLNEEY